MPSSIFVFKSFVRSFLVLYVATTAAASPNFSFAEGFLTEAENWPLWADTLTRYKKEHVQILACVADKSACVKRMTALRHILIKAPSLGRDEQIRLVNRYINRKRHKNDKRVTTVDDYGTKRVQKNQFATLLEFLRRGGDCEDYAISKYFILRELGFEADTLRIVIGFDRKTREHHAVLAVLREDGDVLLLENDNKIRRNKYYGYRFVYSLNEKGVWRHS